MIGPTDPNRDFLYAGTNNGVTETGHGGMQGVRTIYDSLDRAGVSWGVYSAGAPRQAALGWDRGHRGVHDDGDFFEALEDDRLPAVVWAASSPRRARTSPTRSTRRATASGRSERRHFTSERRGPAPNATMWPLSSAT